MKALSGVRQGYGRVLFSGLAVCWLLGTTTVQARWFDNFESYTAGVSIAGQGGWEGWTGNAAAAGIVSADQAASGANSIRIVRGNDTVQPFTGVSGGVWTLRMKQYLPSASSGRTWTILMNRYPANLNWSVQLLADLSANTIVVQDGAGTQHGSALPLIRDQWVDLRFEINLAGNTVSTFYHNTLVGTHAWYSDGIAELQAIDLYADEGATTGQVGSIYYDDIGLGKTIVVNTADNTDVSAGKTNLVTAIGLLEDGDTINFNIPGAGPHNLITPPIVTGVGGGGGYPEITEHGVTIDGYSQPGAAPNSNPFLAPNNAQIKIVIDGRSGGAHTWDISGYGTSESGQFVISGNNCTIRGLSFLGTYGEDSDTSPKRYAIALGNRGGNDTHINGCWIGVAPDGTTIAGFADGITGFRHRDPTDVLTDRTVVGVKKGSANPRAEFNVMVDLCIPIIIEGAATRISGNFIGVLPNGLTRVPNPKTLFGFGWEAHLELARAPYNIVIGTDGDGVNDADERNLLSGGFSEAFATSTTEGTYDHIIEFYGGGSRTNNIIAGNYVGVGVDGTTMFTNATRLKNSWGSGAETQIGSDFDGVSDDLEANIIANNHPTSVFYADPILAVPADFAGLDAGERVSVRGNILINNDLTPYVWADGTGARLAGFVTYSDPYMDTLSSSVPLPTLDATNSIYPRLKGTFPVGKDPYTNIIIDVYQLDPEGWANGKAIAGAQQWFAEQFTDLFSFTNGFPQGVKHLGSYSAANSGNFDVDVSGLDLGAGFVTVTANYSADPAGTRRGRTHTGNFANPVVVLPGPATSVGLTQTVPDVLLWYNATGLFPTNGPVIAGQQSQNLGNWEPYASVLGDSTFLIENNTFASDGASQNFAVALQPAAGGPAKQVYAFYADNGTPFKDPINLSRQNGNPGRVGGDPRYGAVNYMTECETSAGQIAAFQSNNRWTFNSMYSADNRYCTEQWFSLNPLTLVPTPLLPAYDYVWGPFATNATAWQGGNQISRTGGKPIGLDNGNFVVMIDDRTGYLNNSELTSFAIVTPTGSIVKGPTLVDVRDIWDNACAVRGGFVIRCHNLLYFFDNAGNAKFNTDINVSSGASFGTGREDASRTAGDIRSYYVFVAGRSPDGNQGTVTVAAWDSRTGNFVAKAPVADLEPSLVVNDRVAVAVDEYNRCCVAWAYRPLQLNFAKRQVVARVLAFDGTSFSYLTYLFYPFVNHDVDGTLLMEGFAPSVAMTPRQICVAARGQVNSLNNPAGGADILADTDYYAVVSHPAPIAPVEPLMTVTRSGNNAVVSWPADAGLFVLQASPTLSPEAWADVDPQPPIVRVGAGDPNDRYEMTVPIGPGAVFGRLVRRW